MELREIADRLEIEALLTRYAKAVDRKDWALYLTVFTPDASIDYSSAGGAVSAGVTFEGYFQQFTSADFLAHLILPAATLAIYCKACRCC